MTTNTFDDNGRTLRQYTLYNIGGARRFGLMVR